MTLNSNILIVDDDRNIQKTLKDILKTKEYILFQAFTGKEALEIFNRENISLVITDLKLPDKSGLEVLQSIKEISPDTEFIILTGYASQKTAIQAINKGAFAYFEKPYDINQLLLSIQQVFEKQQTKFLLSESQAKYKNLFENATVAMFRTTLNGLKFLEFNYAFCELFGLSREELIKRKPISLWVNVDSSRQLQRDVFKNGFGENLRLDVRKGDKEVRYCLATFKLYKEEKYIEGSIVDITEQIQLEKTLHESEERFSLAFKTSPYAIAINRLSDRKIIDINDAFTRFLGFTREEVINKTSLKLNLWVNPKDHEQVFSDLEKNNEIVAREYFFRKKNGEIFTGLFSADASMILNGERHLLASIIDITSWKTAEKAIRDSESNFKWLYEKAPIPYHILSPGGRIQDVNQRWCDVLGYSKEEALGKEIFDFIAKDEREAAKNSFAKKKSSDHKFIEGSERKYLTKKGEIRTFKTYDFLVFNSIGKITSIQTTIEDITDRKNAEIEILRNLDRMRSIINILQYSAGGEQEFLDLALSEAIKLTQSKIGYIYLYNEDRQQFTLYSWSDDVMDKSKRAEKQTIYDLENTGLWGEVVRQRKNIIVNDFQNAKPLINSYPEGHSHLKNFLTVPIFNDGKIEAVIGVANKIADYDETDVLQLSLLMDSVWKVIDRWKAINALQSSEAKLRNLINATEDIVILKDKDFKHVMVNKAAQKYFGKTETEILGATDFDLMPENAAKLCRESDQLALEKKNIIISIEQIGNKFFAEPE